MQPEIYVHKSLTVGGNPQSIYIMIIITCICHCIVAKTPDRNPFKTLTFSKREEAEDYLPNKKYFPSIFCEQKSGKEDT